MKMNDDYKVIRKTTELINEHLDYTKIQQMTPDVEVAIIKAYKASENELLAYVDGQVRDIDTIPNLVNCFHYTCQALQALGLRADLLENKLLDIPKKETRALEEAVNKDMSGNNWRPWPLEDHLANLPTMGEVTFDRLFDSSFYDKKALTSIMLLDHIINNAYAGLDIGNVMYDLLYGSCIDPLLDRSWVKRPLIGYFTEDCNYIFDIANKKFVSIFGKALNNLLNRDNSLEAIQMKQYLHNQLLTVWGGSSLADALTVYNEIEKLIAENRTSQGLTVTFIKDLDYCKDFAVKKHYDIGAVTYEIDYKGLQALSDMLKALGLDGLQEASYFIDMVKVLNE